MLKKQSFYIATLVLGICLIAVSLFLKGEELKSIAGICIGIGTGLFGSSIANLLMKRMEENNPKRMKQREVEFKDERNTLIRYKAKAKAADIIQWCIMGVAYITILIYTPLWVTLVTVGVFLLYNVLAIYFMNKFQQEM